MIRLGPVDELARQFAAAQPFWHAIIDDAVEAGSFAALQAAFRAEPMVRLDDEIYSHLRGADPPLHPALRTFVAALPIGEVSRICGRPLSRADGAAYAYGEGDYLLPHSDAGANLRRAVAYAYYLAPPARGGELLLYEPGFREAVKRIEPRANRLVLFEVHDRALHEIAEVLAGRRDSIAGWFYP